MFHAWQLPGLFLLGACTAWGLYGEHIMSFLLACYSFIHLAISQAEEHNKADRLTQAKKCGYFALCCNITAIIYFVVFLVVCFGVIIASVVIDPSSLGPSSLASS